MLPPHVPTATPYSEPTHSNMQVIIMLPPHIGMVLLSATLPNVMDFADWVGRIKRKVVHVTGVCCVRGCVCACVCVCVCVNKAC